MSEKEDKSPDELEPESEAGEVSPGESSSPPPPKRWPKKRILRWLSGILAVGFVLLFLLILLAPTIATSGFMERRVSKIASEMLKREVNVTGIAAGWRTPFILETVRISGLEDEANHPPFSLENVEVPLTLFSLIFPPYDLTGIQVEKLHMNVVRTANGEINVLRILENFAPEAPDETPPATPTPAPAEVEFQLPAPSAPPSFAIPITAFSFELKEMAVLWYDFTEGTPISQAGLQQGNVTVLWAQRSQPLTFLFEANSLLNQHIQPIRIEIALTDWTDQQGNVTLESAGLAINVQSDADDEEPAIALRASLPEFPYPSAEVELFFEYEWIQPWLREILPAEQIPNIIGRLDTTLFISPAGNGRRALDLKIVSSPIQASGEALSGAEYLLPGPEISAEMLFNFPENRLESAVGNFIISGFRGDFAIENQPFGLPGPETSMSAGIELNGAELSRAAQIFLKGEGEPFLGTEFQFRLFSENLSLETPAIRWEANLIGGDIGDLPDELDEILAGIELPPNLALLDTLASGRVEFLATENRVNITQWQWSGGLGEGTFDATLIVDPLEISKAELRHQIVIGELLESLGSLLPPDLPKIEGLLIFQHSASGMAPTPLNLSGSLDLQGMTVAVDELGEILSQERFRLSWALVLPDLDTVNLESLRFDSDPFQTEFKGHFNLPDQFAFSGESVLKLSEVLPRVEALAPLPEGFWLEGDILSSLNLEGVLEDWFSIKLAISAQEDFTTGLEELFQFAKPWNSTTEVSIEIPAEDQANVSISSILFNVDDLVKLLLESDVSLAGNFMELESNLELKLIYQEIMELVSQDLLASLGADVALEGFSELELELIGALEKSGDEWISPGNWELEINSINSVEFLEWLFEDLYGAVAGFNLELDTIANFNPLDPTQFIFDGNLEIELMESIGPEGITVEGFVLESEFQGEGPENLYFEILNLTLDSLLYETPELTFLMPFLELAASFRKNGEELSIAMTEFHFGEFLTAAFSADFATDTNAWKTELSASLSDVDLNDMLMISGLEMPLPILLGEGSLSATYAGTLVEHFEFGDVLPVSGQVDFNLTDVTIAIDGLMELSGLNVQSDSSVGGRDLGANFFTNFGRLTLEGLPSDFRNWRFQIQARFSDYNEFSIPSLIFESPDLGTELLLNLRITDFFMTIQTFLEGDLAIPQEPLDFFDLFQLSGDISFYQDLAPLQVFLEGMEVSGLVYFAMNIDSRPGDRLILNILKDFTDLGFEMSDLFTMRGFNGRTQLRKTILYAPGPAPPPSPPAGLIRIDEMRFFMANLRGSIIETVIEVTGLDRGLNLRILSDNFLRSTATANAQIRLVDQNPFIGGRFNVTGLDGRAFSPLSDGLEYDREAEINMLGDFQWRLFPGAGGGAIFDALDLSANATRMGRRALPWILRTIDPEGANPNIRNTLLSLKLGTPQTATFELKNGLLTFILRLRTFAGPIIEIPALERSPIGNVASVYNLDQLDDVIEMTRVGLLLLLADNRDDFHLFLNQLLEESP